MRNSLVLLLFLSVTCTGKKATENTSMKEDVKFEQYLVEGQTLYQAHCANCHQLNGEGLGKLYPPLAKSDYLINNFEASICLMKNGMSGELVVNNISYNQPMPGVSALTNLEVAEIATYIYNSWGNNKGQIETKKVEEILKNCNL
jgi:cytochrome c551